MDCQIRYGQRPEIKAGACCFWGFNVHFTVWASGCPVHLFFCISWPTRLISRVRDGALPRFNIPGTTSARTAIPHCANKRTTSAHEVYQANYIGRNNKIVSPCS